MMDLKRFFIFVASRAFTVLCLLILATPSHAAKLAVLELTGPSVQSGKVDPAILMQLSDHLRSGALQVAPEHGLEVLSRATVGQLVERTDGCVEAECEVQTGRNLGVDHVMSGQLRQIEGTHVLTIKLHETEAGKLLAIHTARSTSMLEMLDHAVKAARQVIDEGLGGPGSPGSTERGPEVSVQIDSTPAGATVRVDGAMICTDTPCTATVPSGVRQFQFDLREYLPERRNIEITQAASQRVSVELAARFALVSVQTTPRGLPLTVDGKPVGSVSNLKRRPGAMTVKIRDECYHETGERVVLERSVHRRLALVGQPRVAGIKVGSADTSGARMAGDIYADGKKVGRFPGQVTVPLCTEQVQLKPDQGPKQSHRVRLTEKQLTEIRPRSWRGG
jgi:hypothetical protein